MNIFYTCPYRLLWQSLLPLALCVDGIDVITLLCVDSTRLQGKETELVLVDLLWWRPNIQVWVPRRGEETGKGTGEGVREWGSGVTLAHVTSFVRTNSCKHCLGNLELKLKELRGVNTETEKGETLRILSFVSVSSKIFPLCPLTEKVFYKWGQPRCQVPKWKQIINILL